MIVKGDALQLDYFGASRLVSERNRVIVSHARDNVREYNHGLYRTRRLHNCGRKILLHPSVPDAWARDL